MSLYIRGDEVSMDIPGLTFIGEVFDLPLSHFSEGSTAQVFSIEGQGGGITRVRLKILNGRALPRANRIASHPSETPASQSPATPPSGFSTPKDRFMNGTEVLLQEGGDAMFSNMDPRPRTGEDNQVVEVQEERVEQPLLGMFTVSMGTKEPEHTEAPEEYVFLNQRKLSQLEGGGVDEEPSKMPSRVNRRKSRYINKHSQSGFSGGE